MEKRAHEIVEKLYAETLDESSLRKLVRTSTFNLVTDFAMVSIYFCVSFSVLIRNIIQILFKRDSTLNCVDIHCAPNS